MYAFHGAIDEVAIWRRGMSGQEVRALHARGVARLRLRVRVCTDAACAANPAFVGPDGTTATSFSEETNTSLSLPEFSLAGLPKGRYLQWRAEFVRGHPNLNPQLVDVQLSAH